MIAHTLHTIINTDKCQLENVIKKPISQCIIPTTTTAGHTCTDDLPTASNSHSDGRHNNCWSHISYMYSYSDTFKHLINVLRYTSSSLAFVMNGTDHINVVFRKFAYSLMSRIVSSPNSIVTAIVNSDAYHQSPLVDE